ncbi:MAG: hypothetical protein RMJ98_11215 [Myxococcales bacterium]|nr:hypothetical protein [Polyangiaceae bacterium]MDW8249857.1 hypothetical protein [Myxococcales bacterium]
MALGFEVLLVAGVLWVVAAHLRRLRRWMALDPIALSTWIQRWGKGGPARLGAAMAIRAWEEGEPAEVYARLAAALAEPEPTRRVAGCNEALLDLEAGLGGPVDETGALLRLLLWGTLLALVGGAISGKLPGGEAVGILGLGGGSSLVVLAASRESKGLVKTWRKGIDGWVAQALQCWGEDPAGKVDGRRRSV